MKVIFLEDVPKVAKAGEIKDVANGYGRNYLIPKKLAMLANPDAINAAETQIKKRARTEAKTEAEIAALASQLEGKEVVIKARAGTENRLYGSVTADDISAALETHGLVVDKRKIELEEPIRQVGSYEITIKLGKDNSPKIKLTVSEEAA